MRPVEDLRHELTETTASIERFQKELADANIRVGELDTLIADATDREWQLQKLLYPDKIECENCKRRAAINRCSFCPHFFCSNCVEENEDLDDPHVVVYTCNKLCCRGDYHCRKYWSGHNYDKQSE